MGVLTSFIMLFTLVFFFPAIPSSPVSSVAVSSHPLPPSYTHVSFPQEVNQPLLRRGLLAIDDDPMDDFDVDDNVTAIVEPNLHEAFLSDPTSPEQIAFRTDEKARTNSFYSKHMTTAFLLQSLDQITPQENESVEIHFVVPSESSEEFIFVTSQFISAHTYTGFGDEYFDQVGLNSWTRPLLLSH